MKRQRRTDPHSTNPSKGSAAGRTRRPLVLVLSLLILAGVTACRDEVTVVGPESGRTPDAPRALDGWYYDRAVYLTWELGSGWDGESFRVYGKRVSDSDWFLVAEVTNCTSGVCSYTDVNLTEDVTYEYFVVAVDPPSGVESDATGAVEVYVPRVVPPPEPGWSDALALDGAVYLQWDPSPTDVPDFSHYRVYLVDPAGGSDFLLGETDSSGFLDERTENGSAYTYRVSAVDDQGHEGVVSPTSTAIPRPDYHGEWLWAYEDRPADSGFRFRATEDVDPVVHGDDLARHFRIEVDASGWWLVPGPSALLHQDAFATTALRCGPGSDASCVELGEAPASGYDSVALELLPQTTYVLRVTGDDGAVHYGALRVEMLGADQSGDAIAVFDWVYQLAPTVRALAPPPPS